MKPYRVYKEMEEIVNKIGIQIIHARGDFQGGHCILEKERIIVLNKLKPIEHHINALANAFLMWDISNIYTAIRNIIESEN